MLILYINIMFYLVVELKDKRCVICSKLYSPKSGNQKVCSDECRKVLYNQTRKDYYQKHKSQYLMNNKKWRDNHKEQQRVYRKDYFLKNKEKIYERNKKWRNKNKDKMKDYWRKKGQEKRAREIDTIFNKYHEYLKTIE